MLSKDTKYRLLHAVTSQSVADEIEKRLIDVKPADQNASIALLATLNKEDLTYRLQVGTASNRVGAELAKKLNGMVDVLKAHANGVENPGSPEVPEVPATKAQFVGQVAGMTTDITIEADMAGADGNITLIADSVSTIADLIIAHNLVAGAGEQVSVVLGDDTQIPTEDIVLSGGADLVPAIPAVPASDPDLIAAKIKMGSEHLSNEGYVYVLDALCDVAAAKDFEAAFNKMVDLVQSI